MAEKRPLEIYTRLRDKHSRRSLIMSHQHGFIFLNDFQEASFVYNTTTPTDINHDFLFRDGITSQVNPLF